MRADVYYSSVTSRSGVCSQIYSQAGKTHTGLRSRIRVDDRIPNVFANGTDHAGRVCLIESQGEITSVE
jgi:hypothetical protein